MFVQTGEDNFFFSKLMSHHNVLEYGSGSSTNQIVIRQILTFIDSFKTMVLFKL